MATPLSLLRRWVNDYFNRHDDEAARAFVSPDYALHIGDIVFAGRDESWLPAVAAQFRLFPGLGMTVHRTLTGADWAAAWFSEHGASNGRVACWSGVAIYFSDGDKLTRCIAQEDYQTRQRQLKSGLADPVDPPAAAPWDIEAAPRDEAAEAAVARWLKGAWPWAATDVRCDDDPITGEPLRFEVRNVEIDALLSSGPEVVFHTRQTGVYLGGLPGVEATGESVVLHGNGLVRVEADRVHSGRVIRDRAGLRAAMRRGASR